jgi:hypothetical protein
VSDAASPRATSNGARIAIVVLWTALLADAAWGVCTLRTDELTKGMPTWVGVVSILLPLVFFPIVATRPKRPEQAAPLLVRWIDARAGAGAVDAFVRALRPNVLIAAVWAVTALGLAVRVLSGSAGVDAWWIVGISCSAAAGFLLAHAINRRRAGLGF